MLLFLIRCDEIINDKNNMSVKIHFQTWYAPQQKVVQFDHVFGILTLQRIYSKKK